jgi:serine protease Do
LVGVNTAIVGESYRGVSFSIPSNVVKNVLEQILESGKMRRGWLGVELVKASEWNKRVDDAEEISSKARLPVRGAVVKMLVRNSPAETAGLQIGDTILELNGQRVKGVEDLIFVIGKTTVGVSVQLLVEREMVQSKINVTVGERPDFP